MNTKFKKSFAKDLKKKSHEKKLLEDLKEIIQEVEKAAKNKFTSL